MNEKLYSIRLEVESNIDLLNGLIAKKQSRLSKWAKKQQSDLIADGVANPGLEVAKSKIFMDNEEEINKEKQVLQLLNKINEYIK